MKLERITIENFRGIERLELDLQDELERVRDVVPIVGPNASGKTTILDAITLCLGPVTELWTIRPDLAVSPESLVRRGSLRARVTCTVRFSDAEIARTKEVFERTGYPKAAAAPSANRVEVRWEYPDPAAKHERGRSRFDPGSAYLLFKGRKVAIQNLYVPEVSAHSLRDLGGVFMFDQRRTGLGQRIRPKASPIAASDGHINDYTHDARDILLALAVRAQAKQGPETTERAEFERLCELYARVCKPHRIKGLYNTETGLDMEFEGPNGSYLYDGLSSGQVMLLLLLLQFARNRIHRSIVLIDELELHLHPLWQARLYQSLGELGLDNQILFTTHSTYLRDLLNSGDTVHCTGELGDQAVRLDEV